MRVCFFIPSLGDGGAQRQCIALLNTIQHVQGVEVHLILLGPGEHEDSLDTSELQVHRTEVPNFASPRALAFVVRTLHRVRPDLIISWLPAADIWAYVATRIVRGVPWVITQRGFAPHPDEIIQFELRKFFGRRAAAAIVANSEGGKQIWDSLAPRSPVLMIPNMVIDQPRVEGSDADRMKSVECLFVGRLDDPKNIGPMTIAFTRFVATHPQARLLVVGKGPQAGEVVQIAEEAGIAEKVEMLGFRKDVRTLMSRARVLLSFSLSEGMPNVLMEAVAAGLPAAVSDIPAHRALLGDDYPYYVDLASSAEESAAVIAKAWADGPVAVEQAYAHAREVLATMTPEKVASAYLDVFAKVCARDDSWTIRDKCGRRGVRRR